MDEKEVTILVAISVAIIGIFSTLFYYGIEYRPIVGYSLNEQKIPKEIDTSYKPNLFQDYYLQIKNSGKTDASSRLHFFCVNATISNDTKKPYYYINESEAFIYFTISKDNPQYYSGDDIKITVKINENVECYSCRYEVLTNPNDKSISGQIYKFFGEIKGYYPTSLKDEKMNDKFILVQ